jgi:hypothetical protein
MTDATRTQATNFATPEHRAPGPQTQAAPSTCCGGPAPTSTDACCAKDAEVKSAGGAGCGCGSAPSTSAAAAKKTGCCG